MGRNGQLTFSFDELLLFTVELGDEVGGHRVADLVLDDVARVRSGLRHHRREAEGQKLYIEAGSGSSTAVEHAPHN